MKFTLNFVVFITIGWLRVLRLKNAILMTLLLRLLAKLWPRRWIRNTAQAGIALLVHLLPATWCSKRKRAFCSITEANLPSCSARTPAKSRILGLKIGYCLFIANISLSLFDCGFAEKLCPRNTLSLKNAAQLTCLMFGFKWLYHLKKYKTKKKTMDTYTHTRVRMTHNIFFGIWT